MLSRWVMLKSKNFGRRILGQTNVAIQPQDSEGTKPAVPAFRHDHLSRGLIHRHLESRRHSSRMSHCALAACPWCLEKSEANKPCYRTKSEQAP